MAYNEGSFAVQLPNQQPSLGQILQSGLDRNERKQERADALAERQREFDQRNELAQQEKVRTNTLFNLKALQDAADPKNYENPNSKITKALGVELEKTYNELLLLVGQDPLMVRALIQERFGKYHKWASMARHTAKMGEQQQTEFNKTYGNTDLTAVNQRASETFSKAYFNEDGTLKDPSQINPEVNLYQDFNDPNTLASFVNSTKPLNDWIDKIPKRAIEGSEYKSNKGSVVAKDWKGFITDFTDISGDDNKPSAILKYDTAMLDDNGEPIKVATEELRKSMESDPSVKASFDKIWLDKVKEKRLDKYDSHTLDILKENFRHSFMDDKLSKIHEIGLKTKDVTPRPQSTTNFNYFGAASKPNASLEFIRNGIQVLGSGNAEAANQYFSTWKAQNKKDFQGKDIGFDKVSYTPYGLIKITYTTPINKNGVIIANDPIDALFNPNDPQLENKLIGLHQQLMGADAMMEKSAQVDAINKSKGKQKPSDTKNKVVVGKKDENL